MDRGRQPIAGAAERHPRRGESAQVCPVSRCLRHQSRPISFGDNPAGIRSDVAAPATPIRMSHASNSGAGRRPSTRAHIERVVERCALVVQHDVVGAGHAHDEVDAGHAQQRQQSVHVVLVGLGMVGVADVHAHRQAEQLAAEMILQAGADDLLAVVEVFRADEADDGVDQQRRECARHGIGARLERLLVDAVVRVGRQRAALAGLEIHDVVAERAAAAATARHRAPRAAARGRRRSCGSPPRCRAIDWKTRSTGAPRSMRRERGGDMGQHAGLRRDGVALADSRRACVSSAIGGSTLSVAGLMPITASPQPSSRPSRMEAAMPGGSSVGWFGCSRTESRPGRPMRVAEARDHAAFRGDRHQVLVAHQLADRGRHLRREPGRERGQRRGVGRGSSHSRNSPTVRCGDRGEGRGVMGIDDQPGDLVRLVGDHRLGEEGRQRQVGQRHLRRHPLCRTCRAASPASRSPDRSGVARARRLRRSSNTWRVPRSVCA